MRLFVAITLPSGIKEALAQAGKGLASQGFSVPKEENLHLTLRFIGQADGAQAEDIARRLGTVVVEPFEARLSGIGAFPSDRNPRIIWAGVESAGKIEMLARKVDEALDGYPGGEEFKAHITIARSGKGAHCLLDEGRRIAPLGFVVRGFALMESRPGAGGYRHILIRAYGGT